MNEFLLIVALVMLVGIATVFMRGTALTLAKSLLLLLFVLSASAAAGLLYFSIAYESKGAGVLMFAAVPFVIIGWIAWVFLKGDRTQAHFSDHSFDSHATHTREKLDDMRADFEEVIRHNTQQLKRFWLSPLKRKQYRDEISHAQFMLRYIAQQLESLQRPREALQRAEQHGAETVGIVRK